MCWQCWQLEEKAVKKCQKHQTKDKYKDNDKDKGITKTNQEKLAYTQKII